MTIEFNTYAAAGRTPFGAKIMFGDDIGAFLTDAQRDDVVTFLDGNANPEVTGVDLTLRDVGDADEPDVLLHLDPTQAASLADALR
jgi:hypothetical protein